MNFSNSKNCGVLTIPMPLPTSFSAAVISIKTVNPTVRQNEQTTAHSHYLGPVFHIKLYMLQLVK